MRVKAKNAVGESDWSTVQWATPGDASPPDAPFLTLTDGDQEVIATWTDPENNGAPIEYWWVRHRFWESSDEWSEVGIGGTDRVRTISPLVNGQVYEVQVSAENLAGRGAWSNIELGSPRPDGAPGAAVLALSPRSEKIDVSWKQPNNYESEITLYRLQHRAIGDDWTTTTLLPDPDSEILPTNASITGLINNTTYQVRMQARNEFGNGGWSDVVEATPGGTPAPPTAPRNLILIPGNNEITAEWYPPANDMGNTITGYGVEYREKGAANWTSHTHTSIFQSTKIQGLSNTVVYEVRVRANNTNGSGDWSEVRSSSPVGPPSAPVVTLDPGNGELDLTWTISSDGGSPITKYRLRYLPEGGEEQRTNLPESAIQTKSYTLTGLTNGTEHEIQLKAGNVHGFSEWSDMTTAIPGVPSKPDVSLTPTPGSTEMTWSIDDHGSAITMYRLRYTPVGGSTTVINLPDDSLTSLSYTLTGLTVNTTYELQLRAQNANGWGTWSDAKLTTPGGGVPDAPVVTLTAGDTEIEASWNTPNANGYTISGYAVEYKATANNTWLPWTHDDLTTTTTITNLTNGTSTTSAPTPPTAPATAPGPRL